MSSSENNQPTPTKMASHWSEMETDNNRGGDNGDGDGDCKKVTLEIQDSRTFDGSLETSSSGHDTNTSDDGQEVKQQQQQNGDGNTSSAAEASAGEGGAIENITDPVKQQKQEQQQPTCTSKRWLYLLIGILVCVVVAAVGFGVGYVLVGDKDSTTTSTSTSSVDERDGGQVDNDVEVDETTASPTEPVVATDDPTTTEAPTKSPSKQPTMNPTSSSTETVVPPPPPIDPPTSLPADPSTSNSSATTETQEVDVDMTNSNESASENTDNNDDRDADESPSAGSDPETEPESEQQDGPRPVTYIPGNLTHVHDGLLLSEGLSARSLANSNSPVQYFDGRVSSQPFHVLPDAGAAFADTRWWNEGGIVYVSNSEHLNTSLGGVGAITMDKDGNVIDYRMLLENTTANCGGGRTPWNTWVSCEEVEFDGKIYQVDPLGVREPQEMTLGSAGGRWESFAYDVRDKDVPRFFATEDHNKGTVRRFTPDVTHWDSNGDEWKMLHEEGVTDYLMVEPNLNMTGGTFKWTNNIEDARNNARSYYPQTEGIDVQGSKMYVVCKRIKQLFTFDLDDMTYTNVSTTSGLFDGSPDQMERILEGQEGGLLYFTEEGSAAAGIHARDEKGRFFTILESYLYQSETTGLSFSPDGMSMFVAYQANGIVFQIWRDDGYPFNFKSLDVKYHAVNGQRRLNSQWITV